MVLLQNGSVNCLGQSYRLACVFLVISELSHNVYSVVFGVTEPKVCNTSAVITKHIYVNEHSIVEEGIEDLLFSSYQYIDWFDSILWISVARNENLSIVVSERFDCVFSFTGTNYLKSTCYKCCHAVYLVGCFKDLFICI